MTFGVSRFRRLLPVACASLAMTNVADLVDVTIAGRVLGESALGAIQLVWPIAEFIFFIAMTVASGTSIRYAISMGRFDRPRSSLWFSNGLVLSLVIGCISAAGMFLVRDLLLSFFGVGADIADYVVPYWNMFAFYALFSPINVFLVTMVCADGDTRTCTATLVTEFIVNVVSTWFLSHSYGTAGCALGTVLGTLAGIVTSSAHFFRKSNTLRFKPYFSFRDSWTSFVADLPASSVLLLTSIMFIVMNKMLVGELGVAALTVMAVISMSNNFMLFLYGIPNAVQPIVGVYYGEKNYPAVRDIMRDAIHIAVVLGGLLTAALMVFPQFPGWVIGVETPELIRLSSTAVRITASSYVFTGVGTLILTYYLFVERLYPAMTITILQEGVMPLAGCVLGLYFGGFNGFWTGYALAPLLSLIMFFTALRIYRGRDFDPYLLPREDRVIANWNLNLNEKSICATAAAVHERLEREGVPLKTVVRVDMLIEDTLMSIIEANQGKKVRGEVTLDIGEEGVRLVLRDNGLANTAAAKGDHSDSNWCRAIALDAVTRSITDRKSAITCGYNRREFVF